MFTDILLYSLGRGRQRERERERERERGKVNAITDTAVMSRNDRN